MSDDRPDEDSAPVLASRSAQAVGEHLNAAAGHLEDALVAWQSRDYNALVEDLDDVLARLAQARAAAAPGGNWH